MWNCICLLWTLLLNCNLNVFIALDVSQWSVTVHMRWEANGQKTIYEQRQSLINFTCNIETHLGDDGLYKGSLTAQLQTVKTHKPVRRWNQLRDYRNLKLSKIIASGTFLHQWLMDVSGGGEQIHTLSLTHTAPCNHPQHSVVGDWNQLNIVVTR